MPENKVFSLDDDLELLSSTAIAAGRIALDFFGHKPQIWMKAGDRSPVSEADFAVDAYLKAHLLRERPDYGWISEESADDRASQTYQRKFVVDPIDGTRGFISGSSQWCISIAIIEEGQPICGVLECPAMQEHYRAHRNGNAMMNGTPLPLHTNSDKHGRIRFSGSSGFTHSWPKPLIERLEFAPSIPSLAYRLALIAKAELDVVLVRPNSHDWDIAAADIILRQSGHGLTTSRSTAVDYGHPPFCHGLLLAGGILYQQHILPYL